MFNNCILFNVKHLERQLSQIAEEEFAKIGIHHSYGYMLSVIASRDYIKTKEIASILNLKSSTVTRMVAKLIQDDLVVKGSVNSPVDISLSPKGQEFMHEIVGVWNSFHQRINTNISKQDANDFNQQIFKVLDSIDDNKKKR